MMKRCLLLGGLFLGACQQGAAPQGVDAPVSVGAMVGSGQQALSMGNGPGMGMNGPGMGMNGPGMGMNGPGMGMNGITVGYTTSADKLSKVGLAYVSPVGATKTGTNTVLSSVNLVKGELRGVIDGSPKTYLSGTGFSGVTLIARGLTDKGATATPATTTGPLTRKVRIVAAEAAPTGVALQDTDFFHYRIQVQLPDNTTWVDPCDGGYAIALPGRFSYWDSQNGDAPPGTLAGGTYDPDPRSFSFACQRTSVQKCAEGTHYKPWQTIRGPLTNCADATDPSTCSAWTLSGAEALQTCIRLVRGDFCGDGHPLTYDGTLIDGLDNYPSDGIEPDEADHPEWPVEALWTKDGAVCIDQTRVTGPIDAYMTNNPRCAVARQACDSTRMAVFNNRTAPRMLNRSVRKMAIYRPSAPKGWGNYGQSSAYYTDSARGLVLSAVGAAGAYGVYMGASYGGPGSGRGLVHLYRVLTGATVAGQREYLGALYAPAETSDGALFGAALTFRAVPGAEGPDLYVGAPFNNGDAGAVYRYPFVGWNGDLPTFGAPVAVPNPVAGNIRFGRALAASPGGRLFIGAPQAPCGGNQPGAVYIAEPGSQALTVLGAGACGAGNQQGIALLAPTDSELLVTALYENGRPDCSALVNTSGLGAVRLYNRQASGAYTEAWKLVMPECSTRGYPNFGLNLVRIGDKLLISADAAGFRTGVDANGNGGVDQSGAGRVYAYTYSTSAAPGTPTMISSPTPGTIRFFGTGLTAYDAGGTYVAVGEPSGSGGTVHFFQLGTDMNGKITASFTKSLQDPLFTPGRLTGFGAHLRSAGPLLLFGSPSSDDEGQTYSGGLYHFITSDTQPTP